MSTQRRRYLNDHTPAAGVNIGNWFQILMQKGTPTFCVIRAWMAGHPCNFSKIPGLCVGQRQNTYTTPAQTRKTAKGAAQRPDFLNKPARRPKKSPARTGKGRRRFSQQAPGQYQKMAPPAHRRGPRRKDRGQKGHSICAGVKSCFLFCIIFQKNRKTSPATGAVAGDVTENAKFSCILRPEGLQ